MANFISPGWKRETFLITTTVCAIVGLIAILTGIRSYEVLLGQDGKPHLRRSAWWGMQHDEFEIEYDREAQMWFYMGRDYKRRLVPREVEVGPSGSSVSLD